MIAFGVRCLGLGFYRLDMPTVPELDVARVRRYCESRVPARFRDEARIEAGVRGNAVTIFDCRPPWHPDDAGGDWTRTPVAQFRYDPSKTTWTLHWSDRNGRWHPYEHVPPGSLDDLLVEVDADPMAIFWG